MNQQLNNITPKELKLLFRLDGNDPCREHLIGYVRGDFGKSGNEFYTTWFPEDDSKKTERFRETLDQVINAFREDPHTPVLRSFQDMAAYCRENPQKQILYRYSESTDYVGKVETSEHRFYIRLIVRRNDYNFYVFAYEAAVDEALEGAAEKEEKPVKEKLEGDDQDEQN